MVKHHPPNPGHALGKVATDLDIELVNAIIQVKSGGSGAAAQITRTLPFAGGREIIAYSPKLGKHGIKSIEDKGGWGANDLDYVLDLIGLMHP